MWKGGASSVQEGEISTSTPKTSFKYTCGGLLSPPTAKNRNSFDRELSLSSKQGDKMWAKIRSKRESKGMVLYVCLA
jgi:hypothetical protein